MTKRATKQGRGRPKGSTSFVKIKLSDLLNHLGKDAAVVVSNKWLDQLGIAIDSSEESKVIKPVVEVEEKIQFNIS